MRRGINGTQGLWLRRAMGQEKRHLFFVITLMTLELALVQVLFWRRLGNLVLPSQLSWLELEARRSLIHQMALRLMMSGNPGVAKPPRKNWCAKRIFGGIFRLGFHR
jgi:hypothetical protein